MSLEKLRERGRKKYVAENRIAFRRVIFDMYLIRRIGIIQQVVPRILLGDDKLRKYRTLSTRRHIIVNMPIR